MDRAVLAARLAAADAAERSALLAGHAALADAQLAWKLKDLYFETSAIDPIQAAGAASALAALSLLADDGEVRALAAWTAGLVALLATMRAPLPAEEFRTAFVADKLTPYVEMVRLCLTEGRLVEALDYVERMRARALVELLGGALQFRPDNPLFFALRLADGWLTVRDAYGLDLDCGLVTLSACETGVHAVVSGDELIGLVRGSSTCEPVAINHL